jgi:hypothetical protein
MHFFDTLTPCVEKLTNEKLAVDLICSVVVVVLLREC